MSLFIFSANGSQCSICGPFEGNAFGDAGEEGYESVDDVESAGAFHDGCYHTWEPTDDGGALIAREDAMLARGTEWDETTAPDAFLTNPDFDSKVGMLRAINGAISSVERSSVKTYTNSGYREINRMLRRGGGNTSSMIKNIDNVMARSVTKNDLTVYRGTSSSTIDREVLMKHLGKVHGVTDQELKSLIGHTFEDKGYSSTSMFQGGKFSGKYDIKINAPKGTRGIYVGPDGRAASYYGNGQQWTQGISAHINETELILDRNTEFRIIDAYRIPNTNTIRIEVVARQQAQDPIARAAAQRAEARAAKAAAKQAASAPKPPIVNTTPAPVGQLPSPSSVAGALKKAGINVSDTIKIDAGWTAPNQMTIRVYDKHGVPHLHLVNFSKAEAQAAKASGQAVSASSLSSAAPVVSSSVAGTSASVGGTATSAASSAVGKVAASEVKQLLVDLGMTKGQLAKAVGKSPSLITEWTGGGHGNLLAQAKWQQVKDQALAWTKAH